MRCPDENYLARLGEGQLTEQEMADFHRHLDDCPACFEIAALLGCIGAANDAPQSESSCHSDAEGPPSARTMSTQRAWTLRAVRERAPQRWIAIALTLLAHLHYSCVLVPLAWQQAFTEPPSDGVESVIAIGILILGIVGPGLGIAALGGVLMGAKWGPAILRGYLLSLAPTLCLAPLSLCTWWLTRSGWQPALWTPIPTSERR